MSAYDESLFVPRPFGFASTELLTNILETEIDVVAQLLSKYQGLRNLLDASEVTIPQRSACFALLAHRKIIEMIDGTLTGRYEDHLS
jgi:hypothetical protein